MGKQVETKYRLWFSWQYEQEEKWINELSRQGLQWKRGGIIRNEFERDASVRYTYRLDYQLGLNKEKREEYLELYRDAGWEFRGNCTPAWFYFRRAWRPEEDPQLYTDRESLVTHYKRLRSMMAVMLLINLFIMCLNGINLLPRANGHLWGIVIPVLAIYALLFLLLGTGVVKMNRKIKRITS
ncbi:DUF2812 domain-containing protein [Paenibacillus sacheonensis]|uniref:DUF2812 domain-containing protein n=1 Tax=Paenibacillus sacheonensis TaxID=742054 RepID=A0A7X4YTI2_9BACL|nr:DUF2812 domain-containing protein [Paenibacillus sacheonensis]MBM7567596.1 hypothetical protein [Paenibacillus sacheonensis]NBC71301.1 DUF2812 domain-containing protein [Paenibacillus sacheonensis]